MHDNCNNGIFILLAAFNGERYIREQIESIQDQTRRDWILLARDDGSTDSTLEILREAASADDRIRVINKNLAHEKGVVSNFTRLLEIAAEENAAYVMLADQDDVWHSDKLERMMARFALVEQELGHDVPILMHSDLEVVDEELRQLAPSFMKYQQISHEGDAPLNVLLTQNFVTGCTVLFNRALLCLSLPFPPCVLMHDWWLALLAAAAGKIEFFDERTVRYRQHGNNEVGAKSLWRAATSLDGEMSRRIRRGNANFSAGIDQAAELLVRLRESALPVGADEQNLIQYFSSMRQHGRMGRLATAIRLRVGPQHLLRRLLFWARALWLPVDVGESGA